ncbi:amino acid adenylation domain-containing protein [Paenibacillus sp. L3-i20]|uniref:non-ribosomal peptide synthetase n=1 Tax=Paenibacillus sp. L3-i20 TaxID=2905833 RepID=UPI001EDE52ED|nr:non-ribosomal peptide synthetase [Paenibacillus sp. L3-i20]GKU77863.1 hypothetical protein L3i20_v222600 [Paenibacillus sp. L3-i20]
MDTVCFSVEETEQEVLRLWKESKGFPSDLAIKIDEFHSAQYQIAFTDRIISQLSKNESSHEKLLSKLVAIVSTLLYKYTGDETLVLAIPTLGSSKINQYGWSPLNVSLNEMNSLDTLLEKTESRLNDMLSVVNEGGTINSLNNNLLHIDSVEDIAVVMSHLTQTAAVALDNTQEAPSFQQFGLLFLFRLGVLPGESDRLTLFYNEAAYSNQMIERLGKQVEYLIKLVLNDSNFIIRDFELLDSDEMNVLLRSHCGSQSIVIDEDQRFLPTNTDTSDWTMSSFFEEQAKLRPNETAIICGSQTLSYAELNERSERLAARLRRQGVRTGVLVGLLSERTIDIVVSILSVWKAGGAYVPIDLEYPEARRSYMLEDTGATVLLTQQHLLVQLSGYKGNVLCVDDERGDLDPSSIKDCSTQERGVSSPDDLAYIIYTSGSTGKPKGVMVTHKSAIQFMKGMAKEVEFLPNKAIVALASVAFDVTIHDLIMPLLYGMRVVLATQLERRDPELVKELIVKYNVSMMVVTPMRLKLMLKSRKDDRWLHCLTDIMVGGEPFIPEIWVQLKEFEGLRLFNVYGPTESTVWSTSGLISDSHPSVGKPLSGVRIYIIDEHGRMLPPGVAGELYIAGNRLGKGYWGNEEMTSDRFIPDPFHLGELMYKTGDLARFMMDGRIDFLGRRDFQVKILGHRVELEEVQLVLSQHEHVNEATVLLNGNNSGNQWLCAYYTAMNQLTAEELRDFMVNQVPDHMIPRRYVWLANMPLTPNGKIDREKLANLELEVVQEGNALVEEVIPELNSETERTLARLWQKILDRDGFRADDHFFEVGGNSILLVALHHEIENLFPECPSVADMFSNATLREMAVLLDAPTGEEGDMDGLSKLKGIIFRSKAVQDMEQSEAGAGFITNKLPVEQLRKLTSAAEDLGVENTDILLTIYLYVLSDIAMKDEVTAFVKGGDVDRIIPVSLNLSQYTDFRNMISEVNAKRLGGMYYTFSTLATAARFRSPSSGVVPWFSTFDLSGAQSYIQLLGLAIQVEISDEINIGCMYDTSAWDETGALELLALYEQSFEMIINELYKGRES